MAKRRQDGAHGNAIHSDGDTESTDTDSTADSDGAVEAQAASQDQSNQKSAADSVERKGANKMNVESAKTDAKNEMESLMNVLETVRTAVRTDPYRTLGMGVMLGLVGGSGLWGWMLRPMVAMGARLAFATLTPAIISRFQMQNDSSSQQPS